MPTTPIRDATLAVALGSSPLEGALDSLVTILTEQTPATWAHLRLEDPRFEVALERTVGVPPGVSDTSHTETITWFERELGTLSIAPASPALVADVRRMLGAVVPLLAARLELAVSERRLRAERDFLMNVLNAMPHPVFVKRESDRRYVSANDAFCETTGRARELIKERTDEQILRPEDARRLRHNDDDAFESRLPIVVEEEVNLPNGERRIYLTSRRAVTTPAGGRILVGVRTEVTQRRAAEEAIASARAAEVDSRTRSAFLEMMNHELRTPLNAIIGLCEVLRKSGLDEDQGMLVSTLRRSGGSLLQLLDDILEYIELRDGSPKIEPAQVDLGTVVEEVVVSLQGLAVDRGLALWCTVQQDAPKMVTTDAKRLRQVLLHLTRNALQFTAEGHVHVDVRRATGESGEERISISVRDTGIGLDAEQRRQLFQPFVQGDGSSRRRIGGTGLGLAICRDVTAALSGELTLDSAPGLGSVFRILLPLGSEEVVPRGPRLTGRIGVVHANVPWRYAVSRMLRGWGLDVVDPSHIDRIHTPIDVLIAEPPSGMAATRQGIAGVSTSVIGIVAPGDDPTQHAGLDALVPWPVLPSELAAALEPFLMRRPRAPEVFLPQQQEPRARRPPRVLVVEDDEVNRLVVQRLLQCIGCEVDLVAGGRQALDQLRRSRPDAILMDCHMPDMDGYETTRAIRALPGAMSRIPIIALTASTTPSNQQRCLDTGMDDFLAKPPCMVLLEDAIRRHTGVR